MSEKANGRCLRMEVFCCPLWLLLLFLCLCDLCLGQRQVQIQAGPLYRVEGYPISISCNVTGFKGSPEQDFEFYNKKSNIISTKDPNYAYAKYSSRIFNKEILIEKLSGSKVLLKINKLQMEDAGELFCHTPNTDGPYFGNYEGGTTLNVIKDTLEASYSGSPSQSLSEGDPLQLKCQASSETFQHTHVSVTWFVQGEKDENPRPIITLDKDLNVKPGAAFEERYRAGFISMDKVEDTTYRLKMTQVQQSDQGKFYCRAIELIQDPDRSWTLIAHKTTTACNVEIKSTAAPDVGSFSVQIKTSKGEIQERQSLDIRCSVNAQNLPGYFFSVTWKKNDKNVAQIGSSGMLTIFDSYKERENAGEMRAVKTSPTDFLLTIRSARAEDQGQYQCEVWQEKMNEDGTLKKMQKQLSGAETVNIMTKESDLAVVMMMEDAVTEGDALRVTCSVSGFKGSLSVQWQYRKDSGDSFSDVISLTNQGVMTDIGTKYQSRRVQTLHSPAGNFTLEIAASAMSDSGEYKCLVSEWTIQSSGEMKKANTQSQQKAISVNSLESQMKVILRSRTTNVAMDSLVQLLCKVVGPEVSLAVRWMFYSPNSTVPINILSIQNTGEISWGADTRNYQLSIDPKQQTDTIFRLMMPRASEKQGGQYQCQVDAYQKGIQKARMSSYKLAVTVQKPASKLRLSKLKPRLETTANTEAKIECSVLETTTNTSRFTITWKIGSQMLLTMDLDAVVKFGPAVGLEMDQRIRMDVREKQSFQLTVQQVRTSDSGPYQCEVEEWLQDPLGDWYSLQKISVSTELVVREKASDFSVTKGDTQLKVTEGEPLMLNCSVDAVGSDPTLRYSLRWMFNRDQSSSVQLLGFGHDGRLVYNSYDSEFEGRLHFSSPTQGVFHMTIHRAIQEDRGRYYCLVDQYQLDCKGEWSRKASDKSGFTDINVQLIENNLHVHKENRSLSFTNLEVGFTIDCGIDSRSTDESVFEVTWSRGQKNKQPIIIFSASRDGTLHSAISDKNLLFRRPKTMLYKLTVPSINPTDSDFYHCEVTEWIQTAKNKWRKIGVDQSGELFVQVDTEESKQKTNLTMDMTEKYLDIKEGEQFILECSLKIGKEDPTHHYSLTWVFRSLESTSGTVLLSYSYNGRLQYSENQQFKDRLRFSRPNTETFHLAVLNSHKDDSGSYQCRVEEYKLDCDGKGTMKESVQSGRTFVKVNNIENKLHVHKGDQSLNITNLQAGFSIDCVIESRSSDKSILEVTWMKVKEGAVSIPIFTARRDGTLHNEVRDRYLVFGRPKAEHYKLTVPQMNPSDEGKYYCQVKEWLLTADSWRELASDQSGELSVHVHIEEIKSSKQADPFGTTLGITIPLICFLVLVIILLLRREHKRNAELKKKKECLWAESNPLTPVTEVMSAVPDLS